MSRYLVTGASRGIGLCIAETLAGEGHDVVGLARHRPPDWKGDFIEVALDDPDSLRSAAAEIGELESIWGLVNNAGGGSAGVLSELDIEDFQNSLLLNTIAPAIIAKACVPLMKEGGRIVNIGSIVMHGKPARSIYGATKAAVASMTRTWALELAGSGILVNAVSPGAVETDLFRQVFPVGSEQERAILAGIPLGRVAQPADVAGLVCFLLAPENRHITGQVLTIDGGSSIGPSATS